MGNSVKDKAATPRFMAAMLCLILSAGVRDRLGAAFAGCTPAQNGRCAATVSDDTSLDPRAVRRAVRGVRRLLARESDPGTLVRRAAELLVEAGACTAIAVVMGAPREAVVAGAPEPTGALRALFDEGELPPCLRRALDGEQVRCADPSAACSSCLASCGWAARRQVIAAPIEIPARRYGALLAVLPAGADAEASELLAELGEDLAHGLRGLELAAALRESEGRFVALEARVAERTAELARAARAKDEFLAGMSHELRTPLNGILGLTEVFAEGIYGDVSDRQRAALDRITESGRHLLALINDILDVAKVEAGKIDLSLAPVEVGELCRAAVRLVQDQAHRKRITVAIALRGRPRQLVADERRLKQVLVNLLTNAVKFTPDGGHVALEAEQDEARDALVLAVRDDGVGIAEGDLPRLFQPFVQLDSRLSRQHAGTGLGLALVRRLVDLHGGEVTVESEIGRGSRFTVALPYRGRLPR
jgi:signal transduction histidine kinase